jgi:glycosyltransferase involved in cell wall biosynthesis
VEQILDIAFYEEPELTSIDELLLKHRGTWEHYCFLPETLVVYLIKFAGFTERRQVGNVIIVVQPMPSLFLLPPFINTLLSKVAPGLIVTHSLKYPLQTRLLKLFAPKECKIALQLHGDTLNKNLLKRLVQSRCFKKIDFVLVAGKDLCSPLSNAKVLAESTRVIEMMEGSCDFVLKAPEELPDSKTIKLLWVGRFNEGKDIGTMLNACKLLKAQGQDFNLTIVSAGGSLEQQVRKTIEEFDLDDRINIVSNISHAAMQDMYWQAHVFVSTSLHEGSGWSLCEAMACGVATVVSDIPSHRWMTNNGESGALFTCGDAIQLTEKIVVCAERREQLMLVSRKIFEQRLSYKSIANTLAELL